MSLLCKLFGHRQVPYAGHGGDYGRVSGGYSDGIGREHWHLSVECQRCGKTYHAGSFHGPLRGPARAKAKDRQLTRWHGSNPFEGQCRKPVSMAQLRKVQQEAARGK